VQALAQLRTAPAISGAPELAQAFRSHLEETEGHERLTRELLERRHAEPSKVKDVVMGVGGKGFLLFARLQPETLEAHVDVAVRATLDAHPRDELPTLVLKYLADAHAIEEQAIGLLERAPKLVQDSELEAVFDDHFSETREHAEVVQSRLTALGGDSSSLKDAAMRLGALNWGSFFQGHPDTPGKLVAFAYAFEHLEIGGYEQLKRVTDATGDAETTRTVETILGEERNTARLLARTFDTAAAESLRASSLAPGTFPA
jgi:ferritin-like metal-binding protein YciE